MNPLVEDPRAKLRQGVYALLIALSAGVMGGRIMAVNAVDKIALEKFRIAEHLKRSRAEYRKNGLEGESLDQKMAELQPRVEARYRAQRPFLSSNDRSRWCTIRALVEHGTYAIDAVIGDPQDLRWGTIDMVKHLDREGQPHLYSSKPTLLPTILAGPYWVLHQATGKTLGTHPFALGRPMLLVINVIPLVIAFVLLARIVERYGKSDWGRLFVMAAATFGTFLTTFAVVLNNHVIGAVCSLVALDAALRIWYDGRREWRYFIIAGLFAALTAANELPALSFFAMLSAALLWKAPRPTLGVYVPAAALVVVAFFATQYIAHGSLRPAYMHRQEGERLFAVDAQIQDDLDQQVIPDSLRAAFAKADLALSDSATVVIKEKISQTREEQTRGWVVVDGHEQYPILESADRLHIHAWDNWYDYTYRRHARDKLRTSYWTNGSARAPVDRGEPSVSRYALHVLVGHHGIFSLTPVWILSLWGVCLMLKHKDGPRELAILIATGSLVCLVFYLARPAEDRNYGGTTSGFRWMFWFAPMWLVAMIPATDALANSRPKRCVGYVLLVLSVASAIYPIWNPWQHPSLWKWMEYLGSSPIG